MQEVLIWGTGKIAERALQYLDSGTRVMGFIESKPDKSVYRGLPVYTPEFLIENDGIVIVANNFADDVHKICVSLGVNEERLIYLRAAMTRHGSKDDKMIRTIIGEGNWAFYCDEFSIWQGSYVEEDAERYRKINARESFQYNEERIVPVYTDKYLPGGVIHQYFWQDLWAAKRIVGSGAKNHFDIGSRLDGFIAHLLSAGINVTMIDIRELPYSIEGLSTICEDATNLIGIEDESIESLSALCSLEHFGLGRYGDEIDPEACFKVFNAISRVMKKDGMVYISVPVGKECLEFNAHRMFFAKTIVEEFQTFELLEYSSCLSDSIEYNVPLHKYDEEYVNGNYRYGLFTFRKK